MESLVRHKVFTLKVSLDKKTYRILEVKGSMSLEKLAEEIVQSFGFEMDKAFGFYNNPLDWSSSSEMYLVFKDLESWSEMQYDYDEYVVVNGVKTVWVYQAFEMDKKLLLVFDYEKEWKFLVELQTIDEPIHYPRLIKSVGEAPKQYS